MKNSLRDLGQDRRSAVVVEINHQGHFNPNSHKRASGAQDRDHDRRLSQSQSPQGFCGVNDGDALEGLQR